MLRSPFYLSLFLLCGLATTALAQTYTVSGTVKTTTGDGIPSAMLKLMNATDSSVVQMAQADENGMYSFKINIGAYLLHTRAIGYKDAWSRITEAQDKVPDIIMQPGQTLNEVAITARKNYIEQKADRVVVNVDALISNAGKTALDALSNSPGIIVDQNGTITMKGKTGVMVYIDDKPTYLDGTELANYLRSLPSSTINTIELMVNPPARYEAAGNAGIINIRTKRTKLAGFNGTLNLAYGQGRKTRTNNSLNLNYRNNKWNMSALLGFGYFSGFNDLDINRHFKDDAGLPRYNLLQNTDISYKNIPYNARIGVDYYASDKATIGIVLTGLVRKGEQLNHSNTRILSTADILDSSIIADNTQKSSFSNVGGNLNYRYKFAEAGPEFTADLDYLSYKTGQEQSFNNTTYLPDNTMTLSQLLYGNLPARIHIYSAKADYTHPLKNGLRLDAGGKTSYTTTDNIADYRYDRAGVIVPDYDKSNHFLYKETIAAAYINASKEFRQFSAQLGLRMEHTISDGYQAGNIMKPDSAFKRQYTDLFPTAYISYRIDSAGNNTIGLNYGKRIDRPYYQDLNPFLSPLDKFTYYLGNPFLRPSYAHTVELSYSYKSYITVSLNYTHTLDNTDETVQMVDDIYYNRPGNIGTIITKSASINTNYNLAKWMMFNVYSELGHTESRGQFYTGQLNTSGTYWYIQPMVQFTFNKGWTAQVDGFYQSDRVFAQFIVLSRGKINLGGSKKLSEAATVRLSLNDIFYTQVNSGRITNLYRADADYRNLSDTRSILLTFSYRFGKAVGEQRRHNQNSVETEQNRVKG